MDIVPQGPVLPSVIVVIPSGQVRHEVKFPSDGRYSPCGQRRQSELFVVMFVVLLK